jgi:UrcA family protein
MMTRKALIAASAAALLFPIAAVANDSVSDVVVTGDPSVETRSVVVSVADLDLRSDRAVRTADSRVRRAANKLCAGMSGSSLVANQASCVSDAFADARVQLNSRIADARAG